MIVQHCSLTNNLIYETLKVSSMNLEEDEFWTVRKHIEDSKRKVYECVWNGLNSTVDGSAVLEHMQSVADKGICGGHGSPDGDKAEEIANVLMTQECTRQPTIMDIPDLAVTKIFSFLDPPDLGRCAQVCWAWNNLVYQPCLWRRVCPIQWALGECGYLLCEISGSHGIDYEDDSLLGYGAT
jgi:hypothetical protein